MSLKNYLFYKDDWATIYCGDCVEIMPLMEPESVDLVVTSPPFNASKDYELASDDRDDYDNWLPIIVSATERVTSTALYIFISQTKMDVLKKSLSNFQMWLFWHRPNIVSRNRIVWPWITTITPIAMAWKNGRKPMLNASIDGIRTFDLIVATSPQRSFHTEKRYHPTQDPLKAYLPLIARTKGDLVFDPFLGSGTTCVAAKNLNRKSIGIEINPKYCEIAVKRLRQEVFDFRSKDD